MNSKYLGFYLCCQLWLHISQAYNFRMSQPQIFVENGNLFIAPAEHRNLVLVANGTGKIIFNNVELMSLVSSIQNSSRDLNSFKRIFGVPSNSSSAVTERIGHLEQSFRQLDQIDRLDSRLIAVERQIAYNLSSSSEGNDRNTRLNSRLRRLRQRVDALEARTRSIGTDGNPCDANTCQNGGTCIPTIYGAYCWCPSGWEGNRCQLDQDECSSFANSDLGCQNGATCVNTPGSYQCQCRSGWMGIHCTKRSGDCSSGPPWELCGHGMCINQHSGSRPFTCICDQGWKTDGSNPACNIDVNECSGPHASCSRNPLVACINTPGSFHCGPCPAGYSGNGFYCEDINECLVNNGGCSVSPMVQCINTVGSRTCGECPPGYIGNGVNCQYVGICQINNGGCHPLARCIGNPMIGQSFVQCICPAGYSGTGMGLHGCFPYSPPSPGGGGTAVGPSGQTTNACLSNPCAHGTCFANGNAFSCTCFPGYMGVTCGIRIDPCLSNPCNNGGTCSPTLSGFICRCPNDFTGDLCEIQEQSCGGTLAALEGILQYPHSSSEQYRHNEQCVWTIETTEGHILNVTFTAFNLEATSGCYSDYLLINDGATADAPIIGRFCGHELPNGGSINSTHNVIRLTFMSDSSVTGLGFTLSWNTTVPYCGGSIVNQTHGAISSPGYPSNYPHNRDCVWTLSVNVGKRIQLSFATMRLENHPNCSFDYLQILDGLEDNAHQLALFCNTSLPAPLVSSGPHLTFRFHSDFSASDTGFHVAFSEIPGVPGCGGILTAPAGIFSSPHHPEPYAHALDCEWLIRLPPLETISIEFLSFEVENARNCRYDFVEIREGNGPNGNLVGRYCGANIPQPYRSLTNNLFIRFHSDESVAHQGFRIKYEAACGGVFTRENIMLRSPYYPGNYPKNRDCVYLISQPLGKAIQLDFIDFDIESGFDTRCLFDFLEIRDGDNENSTLIGHYCGGNAPETILSSMNYLWIRFKTDGSVQNKGFIANFSTIDVGCGGILRGSKMGVIQSPRHPEVYPHGVTCKWVIRGEPGEIIRVTWASFNLEANARCLYDHVEVFDNSTMFDTGHSMGRFCGSTLPPVMTSSDNTVTVIFTSDHSVAHDGFMASYATLNASRTCGGNYLTQYGVLRSPGYPNRYPNRRSCAWTITVPAGRQIRLNVTEFQLENGTSRGCIYDYLEIRNGGQDTSPLIGKYCGSNKPPTIIPSFAHSLYLKFASDTSRTFKGFSITWDGASTGCGGTITGSPQGSIMSPNYPQHYGISTECIWKITVNQGSAVQLTFVDLDIQRRSNCYMEYLEIRGGVNRNAKLIGKYCYSDSVLVVNSTTNSIRLKYVSRFGGSGRGFHLLYQTVCDRVIEGFGSVIESPNFPKAYPHNRNCTWTIRAPVGNMINISFSHFAIEGPRRNECIHDFLQVSEVGRNTPRTPPTVIGKYCGTNVPPLIASTKDTVFVNFVSDHSMAYNGFRLEWIMSGCGGRLVGQWGILKTPNYPRHYPLSVQCIWHITTELGSKVELNVWELDIEQADNCSYDHLRVYGGEDANSALITELCHKSNARVTVQSHGNNMYVVFHSDFTVSGKGFYGSYSQVRGGCGGRLIAPKGTINSPNWPSNYDHDDDCGWLLVVDDNHVVQLEFTDFAVENHINCTYDHVAVYDGRSENAPQLLMHCGSQLPDPPIIKSTGNQMFVKFKTDGSTARKGFRAKFSTACGARLSRRMGEISTIGIARSVLSPSNNCTWFIMGNSEDHVTLTFTYIDIHTYTRPSANTSLCDTTFVEVLDGEDEDAPSVGRFCAGSIPPAITSRGSSLVVKLFQKNGVGQGFRATYEISASACGGTLVSMQGSFTSPNFPVGYPMNAECIWNVRSSPGNKVLVSFRQMTIESSDYCNNDFVEIHEDSSSGRLLGHYCGDSIPGNTTAAENLWVLFRSDGEGQAPGFWADYALQHGNELNGTEGQIASPLWPTSGFYSGDYFWRVTVGENMVIRVVFTEFSIGSAPTTQCYDTRIEFRIHDGYDETAPTLLNQCGQTMPEPVTSTGNVIYISYKKPVLHSYGTFHLRWSEMSPPELQILGSTNITGCGGNFTIAANNMTTLLSPNYPSQYASNMRCEWHLLTDQLHRVKVKVEDFDVESSVGCRYDRVEFYETSDSGDDYVLNSTQCHRTLVGTELISTGRSVKIVMVTDGTVQRPGFNFTISTACGGIIRSMNGEVGRITSPNYGNGNYGHDICTWILIVRPGRTIKISFNDMDIAAPPSGGCTTDSLVLRNGGHPDSPLLGGTGKFCGNTKPQDMETSSNRLFVRFIAYSSSRRGFSFTYSEVSQQCGGQIMLTEDVREFTFNSPNYNQPPPPYTECEWVISAPSHDAVQIDFLLIFDVATTFGCEQSGVEIRDGGTRISPLINKFCRDMPGTQKSTGNHLYLRYYTSAPEPRTGFKAKASIARCGGTIVGWSGTLTSPSYPASYDINLSCLWTIKGPEGSYLILEFMDLDLNSGRNNCSQDNLLVTEQNITGIPEPRNWTLCGNNEGVRPSRIETGMNQVHVLFTTDGRTDGTSKGFKLRYRSSSESCGGYLTAPSGFIQSPGYPRGYTHYRYCTWHIKAPAGRRIRLEFLDFDLEERLVTATFDHCYDYVAVTQGKDTYYLKDRRENLLYNGSLCGSTLPAPVETTGEYLHIVFKTDSSVAHRGFKAKYSTELPALCGGTVPVDDTSGTFASPNATTGTPNTTTSIHCVWEKGGESENTTTIVTINRLYIPQPGQSDTAPVVTCTNGGFVSVSPHGSWWDGWKSYCGSITNKKIYLPGNSFGINYRVANPLAYFNITYKVSQCGGTLFGPGNITSPNFPSTYETNTECIWLLEFAWNTQIKLVFTDMDLDDSRNAEGCDKDYVLVRNGQYPTSPLLGKYCGTNLPDNITSMSRFLFLEFHSDENSNGNRRGFRLVTEDVPRGCGGVIHSKRGNLFSPRIPTNYRPGEPLISKRYPHNTECEWIVETVPGYQLRLEFTNRFDIEISANCTNDYVEISEEKKGEWKSLGKFCGKQIPPGFNTTSTRAKILFHSNNEVNAEGFAFIWFSVCGGVYTDRSGEIRSATYDRDYSLSSFQYWTFRGWENVWETQKCDYVIQGSSASDYVVGEFVEPFHVSPPASAYGLASIAGAAVQCPIVNVTIWEGNDTSLNPQRPRRSGGIFCGEQVPPAFIATGAAVISYNYRAVFENYGFRLKYNIYQCGGTITEPTTISSPGHPYTSAPNMNCTWVIKAPSNKVPRLKMERLELELHPDCNYDGVHIYEGAVIDTSKILASYCGNLTSDLRRLSSRSDSMVLQFVTDYSIQQSGFAASIDFTLGPQQGCGGIINLTASGVSQNIRSPDGDNDGKYDSELQCDWIVIGLDYQMIELSFSTFTLEGIRTDRDRTDANDPCPYDYVEVRDGPGPYSESLGKFCSNALPPRLSSATNFMWITFVSDGSYNFPGFRATVTSRPSPCGSSFALNATKTSQQLTSPSYPQNYGPNLRCRYVVTGSGPWDRVDIRFEEVQIESSQDCSKDRLRIRDVSNSYTSKDGLSGPLLFNGARRDVDWRYSSLNIDQATIMQDISYCGSLTTLPPDFISIGRSAEIMFETDSAGSAKGFKIVYQSAGCNRTHTSPQGRIYSHQWPSIIPPYSTCVFSINAQNGSTISLFFNSFIFPESTSCESAAFEVRESSQSGTVLARYCGSALPNPIFSSSNTLWVQYFTRGEITRGFDVTYVTTPYGVGCGGDIFHTAGSFASPYYPSNYSRDSDCRWRIRVPATLQIQLDFTTFNIVGDCANTFVEVSSMSSHALSNDPVLIAKYCPGDTPSHYIGNTDMAMVRFKSSVNNTGNGWRVTFSGAPPTQLPL